MYERFFIPGVKQSSGGVLAHCFDKKKKVYRMLTSASYRSLAPSASYRSLAPSASYRSYRSLAPSGDHFFTKKS